MPADPRPTPLVVIVDYDPGWPASYRAQERVIRAALGDRVRLIEHAGSTAVPGLAAKPIIDLVLGVPDPVDEPGYVPALEAAGYELRLREPHWYQHRLLRRTDPAVNLHVFAAGCEEIGRMLAFRDRLRDHEADRELYERTKRELAERDWATVQDYAEAKTDVVADILGRGRRASESPS